MTWTELTFLQGIVMAVTVVGTAVAMEPWSRFVHGWLWHGPLYGLHASHHPPPGSPPTWLEANDAFSIGHALLAMGLLAIGGLALPHGLPAVILVGIGIGASIFGVSYWIVHDGLAHHRLPVRFLLHFRWLRRVRAAHEIHHRHGGPPYGLFLGPQELKAAGRKRRRKAPADASLAP